MPRSELSRLCLPEALRDTDGRLAWMNSICLCLLAVGVAGARPVTFTIEALPPAEPPPLMVETVVVPPTQDLVAVTPEIEKAEPLPDPPSPIGVVMNTPEIAFAVPTLGALVVPSALAEAPPLRPLAAPSAAPAIAAAAMQPVPLTVTGLGGERPYPPYPPAAAERHQQGTVVILLEVDEEGTIAAVTLKSSSGSPLLDRSTMEFVRRRWTVPPRAGSRWFEARVTYMLES